MSQLGQCIKKEVIESIRTKKVFVYILILIGTSLLSIASIYLVDFSLKMLEELGEVADLSDILGQMFGKTVSSSMYMYNNSLVQIFIIAVCIFLMGSVAKEIKQKKWLIPVSAGVKPKNIVLAKYIVNVSLIAVSLVMGALFHIGLSFLLFENASPSLVFSDILVQTVSLIAITVFSAIVTIALSGLTKNSVIALVVPLIMILFLPYILMASNTINYTPLGFYLVGAGMGMGAMPTTLQWWIIGGSTALISTLLIIWSSLKKYKLV